MRETTKTNLFQPTPAYKELAILSLISAGKTKEHKAITQRLIASEAMVSLAMVNEYLESYENDGYITIERLNSKTVRYKITKSGIDRIRYLSVNLLESSLTVYNKSKEIVETILKKVIRSDIKNILLYGAGEVCEIMLYTMNNTPDLSVNVLAVIDDDISKIGKKIGRIDIIGLNDIDKYDHDGILISTYNHKEQVKNKLLDIIDRNKILEFY